MKKQFYHRTITKEEADAINEAIGRQIILESNRKKARQEKWYGCANCVKRALGDGHRCLYSDYTISGLLTRKCGHKESLPKQTISWNEHYTYEGGGTGGRDDI